MTKVAVVTGAGSGVGRASALALRGEGFTVALVGRRREALEETAALAEGDGPSFHVHPADVTDEAAVRGLFEDVERRFGRIDFLFNNAGVNAPGIPLDELSAEDWRRVVETNLTGCFLCAREAMRLMKAQRPQGGRIVNNGSVSAHAPRPNSAPYTATKHAITGLTKSIALDGRPFSIACGQIDIGNAGTEMAARMAKGVPQADGSIRPEPLMEVGHVGEAVAFMARLPLESNVLTMTVMATNMPFVGRG